MPCGAESNFKIWKFINSWKYFVMKIMTRKHFFLFLRTLTSELARREFNKITFQSHKSMPQRSALMMICWYLRTINWKPFGVPGEKHSLKLLFFLTLFLNVLQADFQSARLCRMCRPMRHWWGVFKELSKREEIELPIERRLEEVAQKNYKKYRKQKEGKKMTWKNPSKITFLFFECWGSKIPLDKGQGTSLYQRAQNYPLSDTNSGVWNWFGE